MNPNSSFASPLNPSDWLKTTRTELLDGMVREGGSAVRFLSGDDTSLDFSTHHLTLDAKERGYHVVAANAGNLREDGKKFEFHLFQRLFFHVAQTIDWIDGSRGQLENELKKRGIRLPEGGLSRDDVATADFNGITPEDLRNDYKKIVTNIILKDHGMAREFRIALAALGRSQLISEEITPTTEDVLLNWFCGKAAPGSKAVLKNIRIYETINRANARFMFRSLAHWLPNTGKTGLVLIFDFRAYERVKRSARDLQNERNQQLKHLVDLGKSVTSAELSEIMSQGEISETEVYYGPGAYVQALEMLRHMVDDIDKLSNFLFVVLGSPAFFDDRPANGIPARRFTDYNALQTRIGLEVQDCHRQNPSASLVHLGANL